MNIQADSVHAAGTHIHYVTETLDPSGSSTLQPVWTQPQLTDITLAYGQHLTWCSLY